MTFLRLSVAFACLLVLTVPLRAQETDTTTADAPAATPDTTVTDTMATDTTATDTMAMDITAVDTVAADTTAMAPTAAGSLSAEQRRARAEARARAAAGSWLALTDAGSFGESWDAAAPMMQESISREQWVANGTQARSRLDSLRERVLTRVIHRDVETLRSAPADSAAEQEATGAADTTAQAAGLAERPRIGLQYRTRFEGGTVLEAVVTTRMDTTWKVAGYRIVQAPDDTTASRAQLQQ